MKRVSLFLKRSVRKLSHQKVLVAEKKKYLDDGWFQEDEVMFFLRFCFVMKQKDSPLLLDSPIQRLSRYFSFLFGCLYSKKFASSFPLNNQSQSQPTPPLTEERLGSFFLPKNKTKQKKNSKTQNWKTKGVLFFSFSF